MNKLINLKIYKDLIEYDPYNNQEAIDKEMILEFIKNNDDAFSRTNIYGHITSSSWILNETHDKVLMVYHKIYDSYSFSGGHNDNMTDSLEVAIKEAKEETGIKNFKVLNNGNIFSLEIIAVNGHMKKEKYISSHLHYNFTYLLEASEKEILKVKIDENTDVKWFSLNDAINASTEPWIKENIYKKFNEKLK